MSVYEPHYNVFNLCINLYAYKIKLEVYFLCPGNIEKGRLLRKLYVVAMVT